MSPALLPDRSCGSCTLCCKLLGIAVLKKQPNQWCGHCIQGQGCGIYLERPDDCATFHCAWRWWPALGPEWFPAESHLMLIVSRESRHLLIKVDTQFPESWKAPRFYTEIKTMAQQMVPNGFQVAVQTGEDFVFILPDRDIDLGRVGPGEQVVFKREMTPAGPQYRVYKALA